LSWRGRLLALLVLAAAECGPPGAPAPAAPTPVPIPPTPVPVLITPLPVAPTPVPIPPTSSPTLVPATRTPLPRVPTPTPLPAERVLDVPIYRQQHALSCEAAALRMALGTFDISVSEDALLADLARDTTPRRTLANGSVIWGDPDNGFVGKWDGVYLKDGYGVYNGPIAELALRNGMLHTTHGSDIAPHDLYQSVRQGFPSVVWVPYALQVRGRGAWLTPGGKEIPYVVTEHAVVLAGIDATGVFYADPLQPKLQHADFDTFEAALSELQNRAVTIRP
jgi:uncharacterized protein YvpB